MTFGKMTLAAMLLASAGAAQAVVHTVKIDATYQVGSLRAGQTLTAEFSYDDAAVPHFVIDPFDDPNYRQFFFNATTNALSQVKVIDQSGAIFLNVGDANATAISFPATDEFNLGGRSAGQQNVAISIKNQDTNFITAGLPILIPNVSQTLFGSVTTDSGAATITNIAFDAAAVPEPATWGMMILGFGLAGGALRQRRVRAFA